MPQAIQISNLLVHHSSSSHLQAMSRKLGVADVDAGFSTPPRQLFRELFISFQAGHTPTEGYDLASGYVSFQKANEMLWCINEGHLDIKREHLQESETINFLRDERHGRMHIRFRLITADTRCYSGYMGQSRDHNPDALGLTAATVKVVEH